MLWKLGENDAAVVRNAAYVTADCVYNEDVDSCVGGRARLAIVMMRSRRPLAFPDLAALRENTFLINILLSSRVGGRQKCVIS